MQLFMVASYHYKEFIMISFQMLCSLKIQPKIPSARQQYR